MRKLPSPLAGEGFVVSSAERAEGGEFLGFRMETNQSHDDEMICKSKDLI